MFQSWDIDPKANNTKTTKSHKRGTTHNLCTGVPDGGIY